MDQETDSDIFKTKNTGSVAITWEERTYAVPLSLGVGILFNFCIQGPI